MRALGLCVGVLVTVGATAACNAVTGIGDLTFTDGDDGGAKDGGTEADAASDGAPDVPVLPGTFAGAAHFLQTGQSLSLTIAVEGGPAVPLGTVSANGPFSFNPNVAANAKYVVAVADPPPNGPECWIKSGATGNTTSPTALDVRCRLITQSTSTVTSLTSSATYVDVPAITPYVFTTDIPSDVFVTLSMPQIGDTNGRLAVSVDGVLDEAQHTLVYYNSLAVVTVRSLPAGNHTIKAVYKTTGAKLNIGSATMDKTMVVAVLQSLSTFRSVQVVEKAAPFSANDVTPDTRIPLAGLSANAGGDSVVLAGAHFPDVSINLDQPTQTSGEIFLTLGPNAVSNAQRDYDLNALQHVSMSMLVADRFPAGTVTTGIEWRGAKASGTTSAALTSTFGAARLFAIEFDPSLDFTKGTFSTAPASWPDSPSGVGTPLLKLTVKRTATKPGRALAFFNLSRIEGGCDGCNGLVALRQEGTVISSAWFQTRADKFHGAFVGRLVTLQPGDNNFDVRIPYASGPGFANLALLTNTPPVSSLQVIPLE